MVLHIAIVGGGIGGLTLAVALSKTIAGDHIEIDMYEAASEMTQVGAGITFWPRAWKILETLGLTEALITHLPPGSGAPDDQMKLAFRLRKADQKEGGSILDLVIPGAALSFHRSAVQSVLLENLSPKVHCHLSHRLISYQRSLNPSASANPRPIELLFSNGKITTCDILVGADGLRSAVRRQFREQQTRADNPAPLPPFRDIRSDLIWSGTFAYRFSVDSATLRQNLPDHRVFTTPVIYCGKNKHLVAYPILQGKIVNVAAYVSDLSHEGTDYTGPTFEDVTRDEFTSEFDLWEEEVRGLVNNALNPSRWAIHSVEPLSVYAQGGVILLGDAAHAMTPHQGNGAGQAIEDAYILAHLIDKIVQEPVIDTAHLCEVYSCVRQPVANFIHQASRKHGLMYEFNDSSFPYVSHEGDATLPPQRLQELGTMIVKDWEYAWLTDAEGEKERALAML
ncbi:hypothetical protein D9619_008828 [Psilocybe cf. subviscida]|uniref:FAD-binding domain-containing protein n=1 Tax=Psilocybe cf. subviscida TaxID=2480587 RepID=A0A8H5BAK4_9AGAR|nr:hypothetical protein D9619_008828 [Psilocybe cf. subviscida]